MDPFELLLLAGTAAAAARVALWRGHRGALAVALLATAASLPALPGARTVLVPGVLGLISVWMGVRLRVRRPGGRSPGAVAWGGAGLVLAAISLVAVWLVPRARLAPPTGGFQVGIRDWVVVDTTRPESLTPDPSDRRILSVRAWYPVDPGSAEGASRAGYLPSASSVYRGMAKSLGVPALVVSGAVGLRVNGLAAAPPSSRGPFPLVLYSGGFQQGHHAHNSELAEELASRGYVVVGVNHPYRQAYAVGPDGEPRTLSHPDVRAAVSAFLSESGPGSPGARELAAMSPDERASRMERHLLAFPVRQASAATWVQDMVTVLDRIESGGGAAGRFLHPLADTARLGIFGMSFGGSTAGLFCAGEPRCRAGVNLDGTQWGSWFGDRFATPFLYMSQDGDSWNDVWYGGAGPDYHRIRVRGAFHGDFTDGFQSTPLTRWAGVMGPIGGDRAREILRAYVVAFFDRYLKQEPAPLLEGPAPFPEVEHLRDPLARGAAVR